MAISLSGKVVIITGASSGIGAATARELVRQGCKVVLAARSADRLWALAEELGPLAVAVPGDVVSGKDVEKVVEVALERFDHIDVLFANAGVYIPGQFSEGDPDAFAKLVDINVTGVIRSIRAVLPQMRKQKSGDILVTSSISGVIDIHWEPVYSASKHAVQGLVHTLRRQVAGDGIRVGAICPGMVANELWGMKAQADIHKHVAGRTALTSEDVVEGVVFMLTRPPNVTIRDLVMFPQNQDL